MTMGVVILYDVEVDIMFRLVLISIMSLYTATLLIYLFHLTIQVFQVGRLQYLFQRCFF